MEGQEVDWKRLVQFALLGSSDLEQYAVLLVRVSLRLFFAISGQTSCLSPASRKLRPRDHQRVAMRTLRTYSPNSCTGASEHHWVALSCDQQGLTNDGGIQAR